MRFLSPAPLPLLALAALPVIIHIISRLRLRRAEFPTLELLQSVRRERFSFLRLRELLLLIARTLAVGFLLLGLTRPSCAPRRTTLPAGDIVMLVDDSYSLAWGNRMAVVRTAARNVAATATGGRRVGLLTASGSVSAELTDDPRQILRAIDSLTPSYAAPTLAPALAAALDRFGDRSGVVVIITDLQERALPPGVSTRQGIEVLIIDVGTVAANATVVKVKPERRFVMPGLPTRLTATFVHHGPTPAVRTAVLSCGETREEHVVTLRSGVRTGLTFDAVFTEPGSITGSVSLLADSLTVDDVRWFAFTLGRQVEVLVIESQAVPASYISAALGGDTAALFRLTIVSAADAGRQDFRRYGAVVVTDASALRNADWDRLDFFLRSGGAALVMCGPVAPTSGFERYCRFLGAALPAGFVTITEYDTLNPILGLLREGDLTAARFLRHARLAPGANRVLARFSDGNPALLAASDVRLAVWPFSPLPEHGDLVYRSAFVPLLHRTLVELSLAPLQDEFFVGDTVRLRVTSSEPLMLSTPGGNIAITPDADLRIVVTATHRPGIYRAGATPTLAFAVNPDPDESDLTRADPTRLAARGLRLLPPEATGNARELTTLSLWLAAAAFALELLLLAI